MSARRSTETKSTEEGEGADTDLEKGKAQFGNIMKEGKGLLPLLGTIRCVVQEGLFSFKVKPKNE